MDQGSVQRAELPAVRDGHPRPQRRRPGQSGVPEAHGRPAIGDTYRWSVLDAGAAHMPLASAAVQLAGKSACEIIEAVDLQHFGSRRERWWRLTGTSAGTRAHCCLRLGAAGLGRRVILGRGRALCRSTRLLCEFA